MIAARWREPFTTHTKLKWPESVFRKGMPMLRRRNSAMFTVAAFALACCVPLSTLMAGPYQGNAGQAANPGSAGGAASQAVVSADAAGGTVLPERLPAAEGTTRPSPSRWTAIRRSTTPPPLEAAATTTQMPAGTAAVASVSSHSRDAATSAAANPRRLARWTAVSESGGTSPAIAPPAAPAVNAETVSADSGPSIGSVEEIAPPGNAVASPAAASPSTPAMEAPVDGMEMVDGGGCRLAPLWQNMHGFACMCCTSGLEAGVEFTMLAPVCENFPEVTFTNLVSGQSWETEGASGLGTGVRTWLGFQNPNGVGARVTYWTLGSMVNCPDPIVPTPLKPVMEDNYYLNAQTLDVELLTNFCFCGSELEIGLGACYAAMRRNTTALGYGEVGDLSAMTTLYGLAAAADEIEGMGVTASIGGRVPVWQKICDPCNPCPQATCGIFWNARGSVLWADTSAFVRTEAHAYTKSLGAPASSFSRDTAFACSESDAIGIFGMQIGVDYERCLACVPAKFFARTALESQYWGAGTVSATSESYAYLKGAPPLFGGRADAAATAQAGDLGLLGVSVGLGLTY